MKWISLDSFRSPAALACFGLTMVVGLVADLWTKSLAFERLLVAMQVREDGWVEAVHSHTHELIPGWLHFYATVNQGAVFGIGQGQRWLFLLVSVAAIAFLLYLFAASGQRRFYQVILGILLAGVLGNMYDRIVYGYVRDMIYMFPGRYWSDLWSALPQREVFPWIFNIADSLLCVGVGLMILYSLLPERRDREAQAQSRLEPAKR